MMPDSLELGLLEGPLLVFGGPYSNAQATEALIATAARLGIPPDRCICTGDVVAYCAGAKATTDLIRNFGCPVVLGNCEESLGNSADDCGCGFEDGTACDLLSKQWYAHAQGQLSADDRAWMASRPRRICFTHAGKRVVAIHGAWAGGPQAINQFLFKSSPDAAFAAEFDALEADIVLAGHSGLPFSKQMDGRLWLNAGVIGMPANDGSPATWFLMIDESGNHSFHRLVYDQAGAASAMRLADLSEGYASGLETGLWPNLDILPPLETKQAGLPLELS
ncbi:MAG: metallophosphoesterase family protein [Magnetovibrionaceae bacterium]